MLKTPVEKTIAVNEITINYTDSIAGSVPLIFIHGFPFNLSIWNSQVNFLSEKHRVITYDIRGFGKTSNGFEEPSISLFAEDLIGFMDALKIDKAIVCGLSMGGYILLNAATRFPDRFLGLILADTQCISDTSEVKENRDLTILQILAGGVEDYAESFVNKVFCKNSLEHKKEVVEYIKDTIISTSTLSLTETLSALANRNEICSSLSKINIPTLVVCGKEDMLTTPAQSQFLHHSIKNSKLQLIEQAGHLTNLEQPEIFNKIIFNFITKGYKQQTLLDHQLI